MKSNRIPVDKSIPGPGAYKIPTTRGKQYSIGMKLQSEFAKSRANIPGPGAYATVSTITPQGSVFLSTVK